MLILFYLSVDLREIKEVRPGKNSREFDRWPDEARKFDDSKCFVVLYGQDFCLKTLSFAGKKIIIIIDEKHASRG